MSALEAQAGSRDGAKLAKGSVVAVEITPVVAAVVRDLRVFA